MIHNRKDIFDLPKDFPFNMFIAYGQNRNNNTMLHYHDCLELNYIIQGKGINIIEDKTYELQAGDLYVINNYEHHIAVSHDELVMIVIIFNSEFIWKQDSFNYKYLKPFFDRNSSFSNQITRESEYGKLIDQLISKIRDEWTKKETAYKLIIKATLMELLGILYRHYNSKGIDEKGKSYYESYEHIHEVIQYIHNNLESKLSLSKLAEIAHMNKTYFSTYFKKATGINISKYIESVRINKAAVLIRTTNKTITEICFEVGFSNITHFSRVFKKHTNVSPAAYKKEIT